MRHPVEQLVRECVYSGTTPTREEVKALNLGPKAERAVEELAEKACALRATGAQGAADQLAYHQSKEIIASLPEA